MAMLPGETYQQYQARLLRERDAADTASAPPVAPIMSQDPAAPVMPPRWDAPAVAAPAPAQTSMAAPPAPPAPTPPAGAPPMDLAGTVLGMTPEQREQALYEYRVRAALDPGRLVTVGRDVKAHEEQAGRTTQGRERTPELEAAMAQLDDATAARGEAEAQQARLVAKQLEEQAAETELNAAQAEFDLKQDQARLSDMRRALDAAREQFARDSDAARAERINPNRVFQDMNAGGKIAMAIAAGLMAQADMDPLTGIRELQERDIEAQKFAIEQRERGLGDKLTALDEMRERYGDEQAALTALRDQQLGIAGQRVDAMAKRSQSDAQLQGLTLMGAQIDEERARLRAQFEEQMAPAVTRQFAWIPEQRAQPVRVGAGAGLGAALEEKAPGAGDGDGYSDAQIAEQERRVAAIQTRNDDYAATSKEFAKALRNPPKTRAERAAYDLARLRLLPNFIKIEANKTDAPTTEESNKYDKVIPDAAGFAERARGKVGASASEYNVGVARSLEQRQAQAQQQLADAQKRLAEMRSRRIAAPPRAERGRD